MVFKEEMKSLNDAVAELSKAKMTITAGGTAADTLTVDEFVNGVYTQADGGSAVDITTPTAALIVAGIQGCEVGSSFLFVLRNNDAADDKTLVAGDGVTLVGTAATQEATHSTWLGVVTAVDTPAVSAYRIA